MPLAVRLASAVVARNRGARVSTQHRRAFRPLSAAFRRPADDLDPRGLRRRDARRPAADHSARARFSRPSNRVDRDDRRRSRDVRIVVRRQRRAGLASIRHVDRRRTIPRLVSADIRDADGNGAVAEPRASRFSARDSDVPGECADVGKIGEGLFAVSNPHAQRLSRAARNRRAERRRCRTADAARRGKHLRHRQREVRCRSPAGHDRKGSGVAGAFRQRAKDLGGRQHT